MQRQLLLSLSLIGVVFWGVLDKWILIGFVAKIKFISREALLYRKQPCVREHRSTWRLEKGYWTTTAKRNNILNIYTPCSLCLDWWNVPLSLSIYLPIKSLTLILYLSISLSLSLSLSLSFSLSLPPSLPPSLSLSLSLLFSFCHLSLSIFISFSLLPLFLTLPPPFCFFMSISLIFAPPLLWLLLWCVLTLVLVLSLFIHLSLWYWHLGLSVSLMF